MNFTKKPCFGISVTVFITVCAFLVMTGCRKKEQKKRQKPPVSVIARKPAVKNLDKFFELSASVKARNSVNAFPDTPGKVAEILKYEREKVRKGETIMLIDRFQVGAKYKLSPVKSPIAGYITGISVDLGQTVAPASPVASIATVNILDLHINIPERWVELIENGQEVFFSVPSFPGKTFKAVIYRKDFKINQMSQTLLVRAAFENASKRLLPGMYADAAVKVRSEKDALVVPTTALIDISELNQKPSKTNKRQNFKPSHYVYKTEIDKATKKTKAVIHPVKVSFSSATNAAVSHGLEPDDLVIIFGKEFLTDGAIVNLIKE